jgi:acetylornithine deacetylase/succinyl-diaminopimelate desuccinylase-like protein
VNIPRSILYLAVTLPNFFFPSVCPAQPKPAQPDYLINAKKIKLAPVDPAIAKALHSIQAPNIEKTIKTLVGFGTRSTLSSMEKDLPENQGINAAAEWIAAQFEQISHECGGCLEVRRDTFTQPTADRVPQPTTISNVYAVMHGSDPVQAKRMVLVTGHYDSRNTNVLDARGAAPGANDDASGVAVSLECARALSKLHFPATIVFVAVAGEEQGLNGSSHLAKLARSDGWQLEAVLNNDIVGGDTTPGAKFQLKDRVRVFSEGVPAAATPEQARRIRAIGEENDSPSRQLARFVADTARTYFPAAKGPAFAPFLVSRPDRYLRGGDHTSFNREGFAAVRFTEWHENYNHQHQTVVIPAPDSGAPILGDLIQFVDFNYVANVARLNAATLAAFASAPGAPQKVSIDTKSLEDGTTLTWDAPEDTAAGTTYEVMWRETSASDWQFSLPNITPTGALGSSVRLSLPISKDNVIFGVRTVDAAGHRSLVVVP